MTNQTITTLLMLIRAALEVRTDRKTVIAELQSMIWDQANEVENDEIQQILSDLAYDLEYYEPDSKLREEDKSYYGDEHLDSELNVALAKLKIFEKSIKA